MPLIIPSNSQSATGYTIDQSIRFNSSDNPAMSKTFSGAGTNKTWTFSCWFKRGGKEETRNMIFSAGSAGNSFGGLEIGHGAGTSYGRAPLIFYNYTGGGYDWRLQTSMAFADFSAWYHVTVVCDTTNAVASERARIYINGVRITDFSSSISAPSFPSLDFAGNHWMGTTEHDIGTSIYTTQNFDGYLAEIHNIDGQALDCNSFAEFNDSGIWIPKEYSGSYGTNGFKIDGRDSSDLGDDESGNGNDFTTSGLAAHDQVFDAPTNNFCVLNPISKPSYGSYMDRNVTGVNLQVTENGDGVVQSYGYGTFAISSGKWYYEFYTNTYPAANAIAFGWIELENAMTATDSGSSWKTPGMNQRHTSSSYSSWTWGLNNQTATGLSEFGQGVVIGVTTDFDNNTFTLTKNGSAYGSVDFDSVSPTYTLSGVEHLPLLFFGADGASLATLNFGQDSTFNGALSAGGNADGNGHGNFKYAVPSGALAICSRNLGS